MTLRIPPRARSLRRTAHAALAWGVMLLVGCGSAHYPVNAPLGQREDPPRLLSWYPPSRTDRQTSMCGGTWTRCI